uniref:PH domain-containing protein n=1 Tax=Ascaris lumbricoides TaxID=6252 RepID=A0A0M3HWB5_ASCLU
MEKRLRTEIQSMEIEKTQTMTEAEQTQSTMPSLSGKICKRETNDKKFSLKETMSVPTSNAATEVVQPSVFKDLSGHDDLPLPEAEFDDTTQPSNSIRFGIEHSEMAPARKIVRSFHDNEQNNKQSKSNSQVPQTMEGYVDLKLSKTLTWPKRYWAEVGHGYLRMHRPLKCQSSKRNDPPTDKIVVSLPQTIIRFDDSKCKIHLESRSDLEYFCPINKAEYELWKAAIGNNCSNSPTQTKYLKKGKNPSNAQQTTNENDKLEAVNDIHPTNSIQKERENEGNNSANDIMKKGNDLLLESPEKNLQEDNRKVAHSIASDSLVGYHCSDARKTTTPIMLHDSDTLMKTESINATSPCLHTSEDMNVQYPPHINNEPKKECECSKLCNDMQAILGEATKLLHQVQQKQDELTHMFKKITSAIREQQDTSTNKEGTEITKLQSVQGNQPISAKIAQYELLSERTNSSFRSHAAFVSVKKWTPNVSCIFWNNS